MASFNKVILVGNLTRDPELRYTPKGTAIAKIGLAVNRTWTSETGEKKEEVTFVDVDAFGRQAEIIGQYMKKGRPFLVEGRLQLDQWEDKQTNQKRSKLERRAGKLFSSSTANAAATVAQRARARAAPPLQPPQPRRCRTRRSRRAAARRRRRSVLIAASRVHAQLSTLNINFSYGKN